MQPRGFLCYRCLAASRKVRGRRPVPIHSRWLASSAVRVPAPRPNDYEDEAAGHGRFDSDEPPDPEFSFLGSFGSCQGEGGLQPTGGEKEPSQPRLWTSGGPRPVYDTSFHTFESPSASNWRRDEPVVRQERRYEEARPRGREYRPSRPAVWMSGKPAMIPDASHHTPESRPSAYPPRPQHEDTVDINGERGILFGDDRPNNGEYTPSRPTIQTSGSPDIIPRTSGDTLESPPSFDSRPIEHKRTLDTDIEQGALFDDAQVRIPEPSPSQAAIHTPSNRDTIPEAYDDAFHSTSRSNQPGTDSGRDASPRKLRGLLGSISKAIWPLWERESGRPPDEDSGPEEIRLARKRAGLARSRYFYKEQREYAPWAQNVKILTKMHKSKMRTKAKWKLLEAADWEITAGWARNVTGQGEKLSSYYLAWRSVPIEERGEQWPNIALWLLLNSPKEALLFLRATDHSPGPTFKMVAQCFHHLVQHHQDILGIPHGSSLPAPQYLRYISYCLGPDKWPAENTPQVGLWLYLSTRKDSEVASAFERMVHKNKATVTSRLALRFVDRFVRLGDVDYALQALRIAWFVEKERTPQYTRQVIERCKNLLELDEIIEIDGAYQFRILGEMLDMGIIPNRDMFNVTMENAVRLGEPGLAFDIYKYMLSRGRPPNAHTFVVLLEDAIERRDVEMTQYVLRQITSDQSIDKPEYVVSKVLHAIHCFEMEAPENPEPWERLDRFHDMLQIYRRFHDERPLIDLGIIRPDNENPELTDTSEKMRPSLHTLTVMISAYVRSQTETNLIRELLSRFIQLVSKGHPDIAPLAETDHVYNAFLMGMRPHPSMLNDGVNVLATMLTPLPETAVLQDGSQRPVQHARPTVQTWAILLSAFLTHRQPQSAVKIRETMLKHGYQFNQPTWNILIRGFARLQMIEETAASLVMMDRENFAPNERTERALGVIRNQTRLRAVLDQLTGAGDRDYDGGSAGVDDYLHSRAKDFEPVPDERNWEVEDDDWRERM